MNIENDRYEIHMPPNSKDVGAWVAKKIKTNKAELFSAFLPVLPLLIGLPLAYNYLIAPTQMDMSDLMSVFMLWISVDYFLKWHAIFLGQDIKAAPSWYNPNRTYFKFFLFSFIFPFLLIVPMLLSFFIPLFNNGIVLPILIILIYAIFLRVNMLFPSIVKGDNLSLVNIWTLSSGMAIKIFLVPFRAHWACIPVFISYVILVLIIEEGEQMNHPMMVSIFSIVNIFIGAVYFCLFIGGLCRYYTWAMEHRFSEIKGMP